MIVKNDKNFNNHNNNNHLNHVRRANMLVPGFGRFKHTFKASVEEFFSPKLLPVLSFSFLLVALSLTVTGMFTILLDK